MSFTRGVGRRVNPNKVLSRKATICGATRKSLIARHSNAQDLDAFGGDPGLELGLDAGHPVRCLSWTISIHKDLKNNNENVVSA